MSEEVVEGSKMYKVTFIVSVSGVSDSRSPLL